MPPSDETEEGRPELADGLGYEPGDGEEDEPDDVLGDDFDDDDADDDDDGEDDDADDADDAELDDDPDLDELFPRGDGVAATEAIVTCPYCGEANEIAVDPGGGASQSYVEDCGVCCRPWRVSVEWGPGGAAVAWADTLDD